MALPQMFKSARLTDDDLGTSIDDRLGDLEDVICDILGFTIDTDVTEAPLLCDNSGRLTKALIRQKAVGPVGLRILDSTSSKEVAIYNTGSALVVAENTGTETSPAWTVRASMVIATGIWTFAAIPVLPATDPTTGNQATRKDYVDTAIAALTLPETCPITPYKLKVYNNAEPLLEERAIDIVCEGSWLDFAGVLKLFKDFNLIVDCFGVGAGGLDTGSLSNDNYYYFFLIGKEDGTKAGLASLSASAPTMPLDYVYKKLVSAVYYTGDTFLKIHQTDKWVNLSNRIADLSNVAAVTAWTSVTLSIPPDIVTAAKINSYAGTGGGLLQLSWDGVNCHSQVTGTGEAYVNHNVVIPVVVSQSIYRWNAINAFYLFICSYELAI